ncbi:hypothetical protein QQP08_024041 [Theobroma cacao]|nr:hypothetical protein QQP08_024041 [Theobroma cacao]
MGFSAALRPNLSVTSSLHCSKLGVLDPAISIFAKLNQCFFGLDYTGKISKLTKEMMAKIVVDFIGRKMGF